MSSFCHRTFWDRRSAKCSRPNAHAFVVQIVEQREAAAIVVERNRLRELQVAHANVPTVERFCRGGLEHLSIDPVFERRHSR